jgi:tRNA G18 (ribose-2'-O)-methylase SpoU
LSEIAPRLSLKGYIRMDQHTYLEGILSIRAALEADSRPIHTVYISRKQRDYDVLKFEKWVKRLGVAVERVSDAVIADYAGGSSHGGVIARVGERRMVGLGELLTPHPPTPSPTQAGRGGGSSNDPYLPDNIVDLSEKSEKLEVPDSFPDSPLSPLAWERGLGGEGQRLRAPFIVMLDGVEDPYNFGQAVRAFYAAGADGLVVRPRNWMSAAGVVARASAGASERIRTAVAETAQEAADFFRARGLTIAVADKERAVSLYNADLTVPLFLLIGGEKRGVTRSFADAADLRLRIPYGRAFAPSLGTTPAAAAIAFEIMRQRIAR